VLNQEILVELRALGQNGGADRDSKTAAQVAQKVEDPRSVAHFFPGNGGVGGGGQRHEEEPDAESLDDAGPGNLHETGLQIKAGHEPERIGHGYQSKSQQCSG